MDKFHEKSEEAQPQTIEEKAKDVLKDLLSDAATSRTESIKLSHGGVKVFRFLGWIILEPSMILPSSPNQKKCLLYFHVLAPGGFSGFFEATRWKEKGKEQQVKGKGF